MKGDMYKFIYTIWIYMNPNLYEARNSIYCYEGTNVLINKFNIRDNKTLQEVEKKIVLTKLFELHKNKQIGDFSKSHFVSIHKYLFEDIYPFAGKFRTENIAKDYFSFAEWEYIENELDNLLNKLKNENYLLGQNKNDLAKGLAFYLSELNVLHPFREGNGRTIREFIRQLAYKNGYIFDLTNITSDEFLEASKKSVVDTTDLEQIINKSLSIK